MTFLSTSSGVRFFCLFFCLVGEVVASEIAVQPCITTSCRLYPVSKKTNHQQTELKLVKVRQVQFVDRVLEVVVVMQPQAINSRSTLPLLLVTRLALTGSCRPTRKDPTTQVSRMDNVSLLLGFPAVLRRRHHLIAVARPLLRQSICRQASSRHRHPRPTTALQDSEQ